MGNDMVGKSLHCLIIYNPESIGSNRLINDGAKIYLDKEQLLIENRYGSEGKVVDDNATTISVLNNLDELEKEIIEILLTGESKTLEELSILLNIDVMQLVGKLSFMEMEDKVVIKGSRVSGV